MKSKLKKTLSLLLALVMVLSCMSMGAFANADDVYSVENNQLYINGSVASDTELEALAGKIIVESNGNYSLTGKSVQNLFTDAEDGSTLNLYLIRGSYIVRSINGNSLVSKTVTVNISGLSDATGNKAASVNLYNPDDTETNGYYCRGMALTVSNLVLIGQDEDANGDERHGAGFVYANSLLIENCVFQKSQCLWNEGNAYTVKDSTFDCGNIGNKYAMWTRGNGTWTFMNCIFNTSGKALKIYHTIGNVNVTGSTFNRVATAADKYAVEVASTTANISISNCINVGHKGLVDESKNNVTLTFTTEPAVTVTTGDNVSESYDTLEDAVAAIEAPANGETAPEIKVSSEAAIGSGEAKVTVPANSTVTVNEAASTNTGVTAKQITIAPGEDSSESIKTAYVVSNGEATAAIASTAVTKDASVATEGKAEVADFINVSQVLANAVAENSAIDVSTITGMELSLKTDDVAANTEVGGDESPAKTELEGKIANESVKVFDVYPEAKVTTTTTTTGSEPQTAEYTYNASKDLADNAKFTFQLEVATPAEVGMTANLTHYHNNNDTWETESKSGIVDNEGKVTVELDKFSYITVDGVEATDFASAVASASAGATITLYDDVALTSTVEINKNLIINLNGHSITATGARALWVKSGAVEIKDTSTGETKGTVSANGDALGETSSVIRVGDSAANTAIASLAIGEGVTVSSGKSYVITVFGTNTEGIELVVNGNVVSTVPVGSKADAAIAGNGTSTLAATAITINGSVTSTNTYAIYHPGKGTLTVNGTVSGLGGIEAKGGTVTVNSGATVEATAATQGHKAYNNGPSTSGYAIAAVNNTGYIANPATVNINGGTISGKAVALADQETVAIGTVTASSNNIPVDDGCMWVSDGNGGYKLAAVVATIGTAKYASLKDAVDTATAGQTVKLESNVALDSTVVIDKALTIDLNDKTVTNNGTDYAFKVTGGAVTIKNGTIDGNGRGVTANGSSANVTLGAASEALNVVATGRALGLYNGASAALVAGSKLSTSIDNEVTVFTSMNSTFDVYGTVEQTNVGGTDKSYENNAIAGNGNGQHNGTTLNIHPGATVTSQSAVAIYQPQVGISVIDGATVSGPSAIGIKAGTMTIKGDSHISGTGEFKSVNAFDNGIYAEGSAIIVEANEGYAVGSNGLTLKVESGAITSANAYALNQTKKSAATSSDKIGLIEISGGTFTGNSGKAALNGAFEEKFAVSGGSFSSAVPAACCADGFEPKANGNGTYGVQVESTEPQVKYNNLTSAVTANECIVTTRNLDLLSYIKLNVYVYIPESLKNSASFRITFNGGKTTTVAAINLETNGSVKDSNDAIMGKFYVVSQDTFAQFMDAEFTIELLIDGSHRDLLRYNGTEVVLDASGNYSTTINDYLTSQLNSANTYMADLAQEMIVYGQKAKAYLAHKN
jgi:hypothetical protein